MLPTGKYVNGILIKYSRGTYYDIMSRFINIFFLKQERKLFIVCLYSGTRKIDLKIQK